MPNTSFDVIIIGAGIAGSVMAHEARARGLAALVFDPSPETAASRAALALGRDGWHKGEQRERAAWSVRWYLARGWASYPATSVSNTKQGAKAASGYYLIDPIKPLVEPNVFTAAHVTERGTVVARDEEYVSRLTVVAAGPRTWGLLGLSAAPIQWGHTLISDTVTAAAPLSVFNYAPYRGLTVARVNGSVRVGSSVSKTYEGSQQQIWELWRMAQQQGLFAPSRPKDWTEIAGVRAMHNEETGKPIWAKPNVVAFAGFGRCGYTLAPSRASEVLDQFFGEQP